jgi:photosystem II stability/assembly factor-like uncharacterized protein
VIPNAPAAGDVYYFTGLNHGWLVLGNTSWHTADGGRTWTRG